MNFPGYALLTCKISNTMLRITFFSMIMPTEVYVINILTVEVLWDFHKHCELATCQNDS